MQSSIFFAVSGDIHGDHERLVERLNGASEWLGVPLALVLQVGDFEPVRDEADLRTMAGPARRIHLGTFHRVWQGSLRYPAEVLFIGGNHEPYGWLEEYPTGGEIAPGVHYFGRAGVVERHGLRIAGLTGIHSPTRYERPLPAAWADDRKSLKEPTYFRKAAVERLLGEAPVDILLTHDWPAGHFGSFGNPQSRLLLDTLRPRLHLAGHMHRPARKLVRHADGSQSQIVALHHLGHGAGDLLLFEWDGATLRERRIS